MVCAASNNLHNACMQSCNIPVTSELTVYSAKVKEFKAPNKILRMDVYDTIYSVLAAKGDSIIGRTAIQKIVYLSSKKIPELDVPPYKPHYYGPFSPELGWALEKMVSYSFLYEANTPGTLYEGHTYNLTNDGLEIAKRVKNEHKDVFEKVSEIVKTCKFCELKATPLSYASKIYYLLDSHASNDSMPFSDAVEYAKKLGWKVSEENVEQGAKLLERLELVKVS